MTSPDKERGCTRRRGTDGPATENKKALVTGSTAGIGFAIASLLAQEGASVVVNGRSQRRVEEAVRRIKGSSRTPR